MQKLQLRETTRCSMRADGSRMVMGITGMGDDSSSGLFGRTKGMPCHEGRYFYI